MTDDIDPFDDEFTRMDPLHDALGKLVLACQSLETWIFITLAHLGPERDFSLASKKNVGPAVRDLRAIAEHRSPDHRDLLSSTLDRCEEVFQLRNGLVHGAWKSATDGRPRAFRPARSAKSYSEPFVNVEVSLPAMLESARSAFHCCGAFQGGLLDWSEEFFPDDDL